MSHDSKKKLTTNSEKSNKQEPLMQHVYNFHTFLDEHRVEGDGIYFTHLAYGNPWAKYVIEDDKDEFLKLYSNISGKVDLHIGEKPREVGPLMVDIDFHFQSTHKKRQYTDDDILYLITKFSKILKRYYRLTKTTLKAFVFEKNHPSYNSKNKEYKDGFHIIYPLIGVSREMRYLILNNAMEEVKGEGGFNHIPFINNFEKEVFDCCVVETNVWMMFGSKKNNGQYYNLTNIYGHDNRKIDINEYKNNDLPSILSNRKFNDDQETEYKSKVDRDDLKDEIDALMKKKNKKNSKKHSNGSKNNKNNNKDFVNKKRIEYDEDDEDIAMVIKLVEILSDERSENRDDWIKVGWALHNISTDLLEVWKSFSKKSPGKYDEDYCNKVWENARDGGLSFGSLHMWAQKDDPDGYIKMIRESINHLFETAESGTERDIALVIYQLYKYRYKCTSFRYNSWYEFQGHRWTDVEGGYTLYNLISDEITQEFGLIHAAYMAEMTTKVGIHQDTALKSASNIMKIIYKLKRPGFKKGLMEECSRLFYDKTFEEKLDGNKYLMGFENGVYDLANGHFRDGTPDDYVTFTVGIDYPTNYNVNHPHIKWVENYFSQAQQEHDMNVYIKLLLASYLDGSTMNEKFIIWTGSGCHAKGSKIMMHDGSLKNVENIGIGEKLMGDDSTQRTVKQLFRGKDAMYKITPKKGKSYVVNSKHRLALKYKGYNIVSWSAKNNAWIVKWCEFCEKKGFIHRSMHFKVNKEVNKDDIYNKAYKYKINNEKENKNFIEQGHKIRIRVKDYLKLPNEIKSLFLGYRCKVDFPKKDIDIDPWILGYWLGRSSITNANNEITTEDNVVLEYFKTYYDSNVFSNSLKKYNLSKNKKRIPQIYKCNSKDIRLKILAGLIDSDGHYNKVSNHYKFCMKSEQLIDDIIFLARSLGFAAYKSKCNKTCMNSKIKGLYFKTCITGNGQIPTIVQKKKAQKKICKRDCLLTSINVTYVNEDNYYGFEVDQNQAYLMDDFTCSLNSNGKSKTVEFFQMAFGEYCGVLPVTVLTKKRGSSSAATPEMAEMRGKRFIIFQEPENDDRIHVGYMKELTGGDWIYARKLFRDPFRYKPQFKLLLTCNKLPYIPSTDGGTWRRLRVSPWESEFVDVDSKGLCNGKKLLEHQYPKDYDILNKMEEYKGALAWLLINIYYPMYMEKGLTEPEKVCMFTKKYKRASDIYLEFIEENLTITKNMRDSESLPTIYSQFKYWYKESYANNKCPAKKELQEYLVNHEYKYKKGYVYCIKFNIDDENKDDDIDAM
jgi:phage/plasmid-associated DNA primase